MDELTEPPESPTKKIIVVAAVLIGCGAFFAYHFQAPAPEPVRQVAKAPVVEKKPEPEPEPPSAAPDQAVSDALLGLNQPEQKSIADLEQKAREAALARAAVRPKKRRVVTDPGEEDTTQPGDAGGLSDAAFHDVIERWRGLKSCLANAGKHPRDERGALRVAFTIASSGEVISHRVFDESNEAAKALTPCVDRQVRSLRFPAFEGSQPEVKEAKFVF